MACEERGLFIPGNGYETLYLLKHEFLAGAVDFWQRQGFQIRLKDRDSLQTVHIWTGWLSTKGFDIVHWKDGTFVNHFQKRKPHALWVPLIMALLIAGMLAGCGGEDAPEASESGGNGGTANKSKKLTLIYSFKSGSLDPHNGSLALRAGITETLTRLDDQLEIKPWLATKWTAKDDRTWVFTIRDGITFQDGTKLDAAAVKASFERGITASAPLAGALKIESMTASGQELTIVNTQPHPGLPSELVNPSASIISAAAEKRIGTEVFNNAPVGTGPFTVRSFEPNVGISLQRYEGYWDGKARLDQVEITFNEDANVRTLAFQSKEADIVYHIPAETVESIRQNADLTVESVSGLRSHYIIYNQRKPLLQNLNVRKAIDALLDRETIADDIMLGHAAPANGPFNSKLPFGSSEPVRKPDAEEAKRLLAEAGFKADASGRHYKDGEPLTLTLVTYKGRPELPLIAQLLQSDAAKAGLEIRIETVEDVDAYLRDNNNWDMATYSNLTAPRGDGSYFLNSAFLPGGALNATGLNVPGLNEIVKRLNAAADAGRRVELSREAVEIVNREVLHSYAVYPNIIVGINKRVTGWKPGAEEYYIITNQMDVK